MIKKVLLSLIIVAMLALNASATVTVTIDKRDTKGSEKVNHGSIAVSSETYATGGFALSAASLGLDKVDHITLTAHTANYEFVYDYTNGKVLAYYRRVNSSMYTAVSGDSFFVLDDNDAATNGVPVALDPFNVPYGRFVALAGDLGAAGWTYARDSSSVLAMGDTIHQAEIGFLSEAIVGADSIFWDEDGTTDRLYHSGSVSGIVKDIYVPYGGIECRLLKVKYAANAAALGVCLYWDHDETEKDQKFTAVAVGNADGRFAANSTYTAMSTRIVSNVAEFNNGSSLTGVTIYFIAYGR